MEAAVGLVACYPNTFLKAFFSCTDDSLEAVLRFDETVISADTM
jgi:hypothetical protein